MGTNIQVCSTRTGLPTTLVERENSLNITTKIYTIRLYCCSSFWPRISSRPTIDRSIKGMATESAQPNESNSSR